LLTYNVINIEFQCTFKTCHYTIDLRFTIQVSIKNALFKAQLHLKKQMLSNHSWEKDSLCYCISNIF